jgi:hypothetical protein
VARPLDTRGRPRRSSGPGIDSGARVQLVRVPEDVANALASETRRDTIPERVQMGAGVPFSGELLEQAYSNGGLTVLAGATVVLASMRRAWPLIGYAVDPGTGAALTAFLRVLVRGINSAGVAGTALAIPAGAPLASPAFFIAARAELVVINAGADALRVRGTVYGMKG